MKTLWLKKQNTTLRGIQIFGLLFIVNGLASVYGQAIQVQQTLPPQAALDVAVSASPTAVFTDTIDTNSINNNSLVLHSSLAGNIDLILGITGSDTTLVANPDQDLPVGGPITAVTLDSIIGTNGLAAGSHQWSFFVTAEGSGLLFSNRTCRMDDAYSHDVALGDLTGNGIIDAYVINGTPGDYADQVWTNNGDGCFTQHGSPIGSSSGNKIKLADFTGDGVLDAFVINDDSLQLWQNDGQAGFTKIFENAVYNGYDAAIGDIDNDGWQDVVVVDYLQSNSVWRNTGGNLIYFDTFESDRAMSVALGDVDNDGYIDVVTGNNWILGSEQGNHVLINDSAGHFYTKAHEFGTNDTQDIALGDFNGDGYLDVYCANDTQANQVWTNDGNGVFGPIGPAMGTGDSREVLLGDMNGDGLLDAVVVNKGNHEPNQVWTNDGHGVMGPRGPGLGTANSFGGDLGDLNGDGTLDLFVANSGTRNQVWFNPIAPATRTVNDFDGDGKTDKAVGWINVGQWFIDYSSGGTLIGYQWGWNQTLPVAADFDGDGIADICAFYPQDGEWYIEYSSGGTLFDGGWGPSEATPVAADYDGDGLADIAYYASGLWYIRYSSGGLSLGIEWGWPGVFAVPADYDGDHIADIGVFWRDTGNWYIRRSSDGTLWEKNWGWGDVYPVPADYDGDGIDDFAVYDAATGLWYIENSSGGMTSTQWGWADAAPVPGDYDGDGKADIAVYWTATGNWYILYSGGGSETGVSWGWQDAIPPTQTMLHWLSGQ